MRLGILLTVNAVIHRANIDRVAAMVDQAVALGATRVEIAHVQYYGWAVVNRAKLMPTREQVGRAAGCVEALRKRYHGSIVIDVALPDYFARYPKPCMGGCLGLLGFESAKEFWEHHPLYHSWKFKGWACQFGNRAPPDRGKA